MSLIASFVVAYLSSTLDDGNQKREVPGAVDELVAKVRAESAKVGPSVSGLLAKLASDRETSLSRLETNIVLKSQDFARGVVKHWLLRGLDRDPLPTATDLRGRLESVGVQSRAILVAHLEAMISEGLLGETRLEKWRKFAAKPGASRLVGRYGLTHELILSELNAVDQPESVGTFDWVIRREADYLIHRDVWASNLFELLLSEETIAKLNISKEQADLIKMIEEVARLIVRAWLLQGVAENPPEGDHANNLPTRAMMDRLSASGTRTQNSIVAHAETIVLSVVLEPDQASKAKRWLWNRMGVMALLDPEVSRELRLTPTQRDDLLRGLRLRSRSAREVGIDRRGKETEALLSKNAGKISDEELSRIEAEASAEERGRIKLLDRPVLDILTPAQTRVFDKLLEKDQSANSLEGTSPR